METLRAANHFLGLGVSSEQLSDIVKSDSRFDDAKTPGERFSPQKRKETYQKIERFYGVELDNVLNWMIRKNPGIRLNPSLSGALN